MSKETNSVNDEIKEQAKKVLEGKSFSYKAKYFVGYYKYHVISIAVIIAVVGSLIYAVVSKKQALFQLAMVNANSDFSVDYDEFYNTFVNSREYDEKKQEYTIDRSYMISNDITKTYDSQMSEKLYVLAAGHAIDVVLCDDTYLEIAKNADFCMDMSECLDSARLEKYREHFVMFDVPENGKEYEEAVAIDISDAPKIKKYNIYPNGKAYYILLINTVNKDESLAFLDYLWEE